MSVPSPMEERQQPDKKLFVSGSSSATVPLYKQHIFVAGGSPATTVTLPNVSEAEGRWFIVSATTFSATTGAAINVDYTDGSGASFTTSLATVGVDVLFRSAGAAWFVTR